MTQDDICGRLVALEVVAFSALTAMLADWRAHGAPIEERLGYLNVIRANVKATAKLAGLKAESELAASEFIDKLLADVSEAHAKARPGA